MKEFFSSVSPKGQITLPMEIRRHLGVKPKDKVAVKLEGQEVKLRPLGSPLDASFQAVPALRERRTFTEMAEIAREEHAQAGAQEGS
jgi:AbrB family looped-hinge helix DNA binding protein